MKLIIFYFTIFWTFLFAETKRLTFEDVQGKSPFKYSSLGAIAWLPTENSYIIKNGDYLYKINISTSDTSLFLSKEDFEVQGKNVFILGEGDEQAPWREAFSRSTLWFNKSVDKILFAAQKENIWRRSFYATYYYMDLSTKQIYPVSKDNKRLRNVKFSPNGDNLAYVREDNNLYVYDLRRKKERQLTNDGSESILNGHFGWVYEEEFGAFDAYSWSPDSRSIAFWKENQSRVPIFTMFDEISLYPKIKRIRYPKAGEPNPEMTVYVVDIKRAKPKKMDIGNNENKYYPWMKWNGSSELIIMKMDRLQNFWQFLNISTKSGKHTLGLKESDPNGWVQMHRNYFLLNSSEMMWISERSGWHHIYIHSLDGKLIKQITTGEWEVKSISHIDKINKKVYFIANKNSVFENRLYSINFDGSNLALLTKEEGSHSIKLLPNKDGFIDTYSSIETPSRQLLKNMNGKVLRVIAETDKSQFEIYDWSYSKIIQFKSTDKTTSLDGILTFPPNYKKGRRYPVIVHGYGMPGTQIVNNKWGSSWNQYLVQQGYIVFSMDTRGMSGRGEVFKNFSYGDMAKYLSKDTAAGVKHLIDSGIADPERIGAWGWSGGGYFTGLMLTKNAHLFNVGVSVAPVMDFRLYDSIYTERSMGLPSENRSGYDSTSVLSYVDRFNGKLLVIHGTGDDNVHSQNTTWLVEEFVKHDKQIDIFYYPNRPHGMSGGNARKNLYRKMIDYFNDNLLGRAIIKKNS